MNPEQIVQASMQIILAAGDGRAFTHQAIDAIESGDFAKAEALIDQADERITAAHAIHTDMIQAEARGEEQGYSMLFSHAQDTLMTTYSEFRLVKRLVPVLHRLDARLTALEARS